MITTYPTYNKNCMNASGNSMKSCGPPGVTWFFVTVSLGLFAKKYARKPKQIVYQVASRANGYAVNSKISLDAIAHAPITNNTLNTADPTIVPKPTELPVKVPINEVANSGAEPPAAIKVAPATSASSFNRLNIFLPKLVRRTRRI